MKKFILSLYISYSPTQTYFSAIINEFILIYYRCDGWCRGPEIWTTVPLTTFSTSSRVFKSKWVLTVSMVVRSNNTECFLYIQILKLKCDSLRLQSNQSQITKGFPYHSPVLLLTQTLAERWQNFSIGGRKFDDISQWMNEVLLTAIVILEA